ncbi:MAG: ABC transporter substrate-binding protein [Acetobacteraceae bacterium]|nr:ABC transporter substrate-binding protein [Acetobacteraceae bacterium]
MTPTRRRLIGAALAAATVPVASMIPGRARAQARQTIRIGVLNDQSGPWRDLSGPTSVACARQAIAEFAALDFDVELLIGDHRNTLERATAIARGWFAQDGVDMVLDGGASPCALALAEICHENNKVLITTSAASDALTGPACQGTTVQWVYDTAMQARSTAGALARAGGKSWFLLVPDNPVGKTLAQETADAVAEAGGQLIGSATLGDGTTDFGAVLRQAQASKAMVLGICSAGPAVADCLKQAHAMGLQKTMTLAPLILFSTQVHEIGLEIAQGTRLSEAFYWNLNGRTRSFIARVSGKVTLWPNMIQAGAYAATLHYLKAAQNVGTAEAKVDGASVVARMKAMPTDDDCFGSGSIRADGRKLHPAVMFEAKAPAESQHEWDLLKPLAVTTAESAVRPLQDGGCPLIKA